MKRWEDTTAREMLEILEHWAQVRSEKDELDPEPRRLWDILTVLRGPDSDNFGLKERTTAIVRYLTVPTLAGSGAIVEEGKVSDIDITWNREEEHFMSHIQSAVTALKKMGYK